MKTLNISVTIPDDPAAQLQVDLDLKAPDNNPPSLTAAQEPDMSQIAGDSRFTDESDCESIVAWMPSETYLDGRDRGVTIVFWSDNPQRNVKVPFASFRHLAAAVEALQSLMKQSAFDTLNADMVNPKF